MKERGKKRSARRFFQLRGSKGWGSMVGGCVGEGESHRRTGGEEGGRGEEVE